MTEVNKQAEEMLQRVQAMEEQARDTFWGYLGGELKSLDEHEAVVTLEVKPHHLNMMGIVHGGVTSSLLDNTMGMVAMAARPHLTMVTSHLNIHFVAPLTEGTLHVRAHVIHGGSKTLTCYAEVTDEQGNIGSVGTGTFRAKR